MTRFSSSRALWNQADQDSRKGTSIMSARLAKAAAEEAVP